MDGFSSLPASARYAVNTAKVVEVILWLANARPGIDLYHVVKCAWFADKDHLGRHGRPIAGDDYDAETYGPLGRVIYRLLREDPMEMIALGNNGPLPFRVLPDERWTVQADRAANERVLSTSDVASLQRAMDAAADLRFEELVDLTHADPAYVAAEGGRIRYEDMLDQNDPRWAEKAADLAETASRAVF